MPFDLKPASLPATPGVAFAGPLEKGVALDLCTKALHNQSHFLYKSIKNMYNATPATPFVKSPKEMNFKIVNNYFIKILFLLAQLKPPKRQGRRGRCGRRLEACRTMGNSPANSPPPTRRRSARDGGYRGSPPV